MQEPAAAASPAAEREAALIEKYGDIEYNAYFKPLEANKTIEDS